MMTEADDFLNAILDAPDDDAPRLLFADWLEERGDPDRAEFIRVQIALARQPAADGAAALRARQHVLQARHDAEWSGPVGGVAFAWDYGRGFIEAVEARAEAFLDGADELFRRAPVRRVRLHWDHSPSAAASLTPRLADCPALARLTGLDLSGNFLGSDGLQSLLASAWLTRLTSLDLRECRISDRGVRALALWPYLAQLTRLDLSHNEIGAAGVRLLARALEVRATGGDGPRLRSLPLQGNPLGEAGRRAVLSSPLLTRAADLPPRERIGRGSPDK